jgi:hypothetical protein
MNLNVEKPARNLGLYYISPITIVETSIIIKYHLVPTPESEPLILNHISPTLI